jgi:hypothetical protein
MHPASTTTASLLLEDGGIAYPNFKLETDICSIKLISSTFSTSPHIGLDVPIWSSTPILAHPFPN